MKALVVGGSSGIGLSIVLQLVSRKHIEQVYVLDKQTFPNQYSSDKICAVIHDLAKEPIEATLSKLDSIQALYITAGFGHLHYFQDFSAQYIQDSFSVNTIAPIHIIRYYYNQLLGTAPFYCAVMVSIAGRLSSPMFSVYSATKAALSKCIEAINIELEVQNSNNRILEVSPGALKGTSFTGGKSDPNQTLSLAEEIIMRAEQKETLFIPQYDEVFKQVIDRYQTDAHKYGIESYWYKQKRVKE